MSVGKKIKQALVEDALNPGQLAVLCGWDKESGRVRITHYITEKREPKEADVKIIAKALNRAVAWFYGAEEEKAIDDNIRIIEWQTLSSLKELDVIDYENFELNKGVFGLKVKNNSMDSVNGVSFPEGCIILICPTSKYKSEDFVIAELDHDSYVFRQIILEGTERYLRALNSSWKPINLSDRTKIIGVVVSSIMQFK